VGIVKRLMSMFTGGSRSRSRGGTPSRLMSAARGFMSGGSRSRRI
jgi:hypothetical protein